MLADELGDLAFLGEVAEIIDRRENREAVLAAHGVVVRAMARRDVHAAGAGVQRDVIADHQEPAAVQERMLRLFVLDVLAVELPDRRAGGLPAGLAGEGVGQAVGHDERLDRAGLWIAPGRAE